MYVLTSNATGENVLYLEQRQIVATVVACAQLSLHLAIYVFSQRIQGAAGLQYKTVDV